MRGCHPRLPFAIAAAAALAAVSAAGGALLSAATYPLALTLDARARNGNTTISSVVTIKVDRLMDDIRRTRVLDGLKFNGYSGFLNTLRGLQPLGTIAIDAGSVEIRYAYETQAGPNRRLVLAADRPLFFLGADQSRSRAGYELTLVELLLDPSGGGTGTMAGASRVKPAGDGEITLDDFADLKVELTVRKRTP